MEQDYRPDETGGRPFNELYEALETEGKFRQLLEAFDRNYLKSIIGKENLLIDRDAYELFSYASYYENIGTQILERGGEQYRQDVNKLLVLAATAFEKISNSFHDDVICQLDGQIHPAVHAALCYTICLNHQNAYTVLNNLFEQTKIRHLVSDASDSYNSFQRMIFLLLTRRYKEASNIAYSLLRNSKEIREKAIIHIANAVKALTGYMLRGQDSWELFSKSIELAKQLDLDSLHLFIVQVMHSFATQAKKYSIWAHLDLDNRYMHYLVTKKGVLELWNSQIDAVNANCFNTGNAVISLPTSSGKTLIAEFKVVDFLTNSESKVVYLAPTKALGQQVLRSIKPAVESIEKVAGLVMNVTDRIDSNTFSKSNFVVMTPEKLELMARNQPDLVENIGLVVVDEFHSISEDARGLKLDFLLYRLRRQENISFFILSAVIPNAPDVAEWINGDAVSLDWRPTKLIKGFSIKGSNKITVSRIGTLDISIPEGVKETIGIASLFERLGPVLVIDGNKEWVESKAQQFLMLMKCEERLSESRLELSNQLLLLLGELHPLCQMVKYGVAYHHADLEIEAKLLIENAMKRSIIRTLFATTTLAEGVDFPVKSVIVSTLYHSGNQITHRLLNNIAGRAGRAGYYNEGYAIIICPAKWKKQQAMDFWRAENEPVFSVVSDVAKAIHDPGGYLFSWVKTKQGWERKPDEPKMAWYNRVLGVLESYLWALSNEGIISLEEESIDQLFQELFIIEPKANGLPMQKLKGWVTDRRQYVEQLTFDQEIQRILIGSGFMLRSSELIYNAVLKYLDSVDSVRLDIEYISWFMDLALILEETRPKKKFKDIDHVNFLLKWIKEGSVDEAALRLVGEAKLNEYIATQVRFSFAWLAFTIGKILEELKGEKECFPIQYFSDFVRYGTNNPAAAILLESGFDKYTASKIAAIYSGRSTGNKTTDAAEIWGWLSFQDMDNLLKRVDSVNYETRKNIIEKIVNFEIFNSLEIDIGED